VAGLRGGIGAGACLGKLSGDPAVEAAAVALLLGHSDPLQLLARAPNDYAIDAAILNRAAQLQADRARAQADYLAGQIARQVVPPLAKHLSRLVEALVKSMAQGK